MKETIFDTDGNIIDVVDHIDDNQAADDPFEVLASLDSNTLRKVVMAGAGLVERAGDLYTALEEISQANTARPAIEIITDVALTAALESSDPAGAEPS